MCAFALCQFSSVCSCSVVAINHYMNETDWTFYFIIGGWTQNITRSEIQPTLQTPLCPADYQKKKWHLFAWQIIRRNDTSLPWQIIRRRYDTSLPCRLLLLEEMTPLCPADYQKKKWHLFARQIIRRRNDTSLPCRLLEEEMTPLCPDYQKKKWHLFVLADYQKKKWHLFVLADYQKKKWHLYALQIIRRRNDTSLSWQIIRRRNDTSLSGRLSEEETTCVFSSG